jgi:ribonuclease I
LTHAISWMDQELQARLSVMIRVKPLRDEVPWCKILVMQLRLKLLLLLLLCCTMPSTNWNDWLLSCDYRLHGACSCF